MSRTRVCSCKSELLIVCLRLSAPNNLHFSFCRFIGTQSCAACDKLLEYVKDEGEQLIYIHVSIVQYRLSSMIFVSPGLAEECQSCCVEGGSTEATIRKYDKGVLEVCKHRLR